MDSQLVVISFATLADAEQTLADIESLDAQGFVSIEDGALLTRADDGTVTVKPMDPAEVARGSTLGGVIGLLAGGVLGLPVLGMIAGAGVGANRSLHGERLEELMATVGREMTSGTAVIAIQVAAVDDPDAVAERLDLHRDAVTSLEIPAELRAHIEAQRASHDL